MSTYTQAELTPVMENFGQEAALIVQRKVLVAFPGGWFRPEHAMALGLRETGLRNIRGGAKLVDGVWEPTDTDEGWLQITNTLEPNRVWLKTVPGCPNGSWRPDMTGWDAHTVTALTANHNPTLSAALGYTLRQIITQRGQAYANRVKAPDALRFVIAAHNAGFSGALDGYEAGNVDLHTTLGDYSADVLANAPVIAAWLAAHPSWQYH
jgi:hypothetical protein